MEPAKLKRYLVEGGKIRIEEELEKRKEWCMCGMSEEERDVKGEEEARRIN